MANITWSLVFPILIAFIIVNAIATICFNRIRDSTSWGKKLAVFALGLAMILVFIGLFCLLAAIMYGTPLRFFFNSVDSLINGVVSGLPRFIVFLWFIMPLALAYLIYAIMAGIYDFRKHHAFVEAEKSKSPSTRESIKAQEKGHHWFKKNKKSKKNVEPDNKSTEPIKVPSTLDVLNRYITDESLDKAVAFRRFINKPANGVLGLKSFNNYWLVVHNQDELEQLQSDLPDLIPTIGAETYPAVVQATETTASIEAEPQAVNSFRKLSRGVG